MNKISDKYTMIEFLYNINALKNLPSIFSYGLLSKNRLRKNYAHQEVDLSNPDVQNRRDYIKIANHGELHDYANLYFDARNPMMYNIINHKDLDDLCIICIDKGVLDLEDTIVTDRNAASELALFEKPEKGLKFINFELVFAQYWEDPDYLEKAEKKAIKCAEVLVLNKVPIEYLVKIKVATPFAKREVESLNLGVPVEIDSYKFFK